MFGGDSQGHGNDPRTLGLYATGNSGDMYEDDDDFFATWEYEVNAYNVVYANNETPFLHRRQICLQFTQVPENYGAQEDGLYEPQVTPIGTRRYLTHTADDVD